MNIVVDCTELYGNPIRTGIQRVVRELLRHWPTDAPTMRLARFNAGELVAINDDARRWLIDEGDAARQEPRAIGEELVRLSVGAPPILLEPDQLVFVPEVFFDPARARFHAARSARDWGSLALLAYDFLPWLRPELFRLRSASPLMHYLRLVRDAQHVAFISRQTQREHADRILQRPGVEAGPVLPLGADGLALERQEWRPTRRAFVALGSVDGRKNQDRLVTAFRLLWERGIHVPLTLVGRAFESVDRRWLEDAGRYPAFHWIEGADDATVASVLRDARATLYVSGAEGFGLPPVESLWAGIPVIATAGVPSIAMLPEGGHVRLPDADPLLIAGAVEKLLDNAAAEMLWRETASLSLKTWRDFGAASGAWIAGLLGSRRTAPDEKRSSPKAAQTLFRDLAILGTMEQRNGSSAMSFVSYAQNGEDVLLHRVFGGQQTGFYVDVGAYHPVEGSVTKVFYDRGWAGINVEPGLVFDELAAARPRDINLRMVVLDRTGMAAFSQNPIDAGMSCVVDDDAVPGSLPVQCDTLENIVRRHSGGRPVDFLKVDAEGAEGAIVVSTDWRRFRPRVLVFEATLPWSNTLSNGEWEPILLEGGYIRAYFDGINCYYLPEEEEPILGRHFRVPVNVLDSVKRYDVGEVASCRAERERAHALQVALDAQYAEVQASLTAVKAERDGAHAQLAALDVRYAEVRSSLAAAEAEVERFRAAIEVERAQFRSQLEADQAERSRLGAELTTCQASRDDLWAEREHLRASVVSLETQVSGQSGGAPPAEATMMQVAERGTFRRALRKMARLSYSVVRPVVRPVAHRVRDFVMAPQLETANALRQDFAAARVRLEAGGYGAGQNLHAACAPARVEIVKAPADLAEMRRLAAEMDRAILTLAMEPRSSLLAEPAPWVERIVSRAPLLLPSGRRTEVEFVTEDLSVGAALMASGGDWEPHVRTFLEAHVQADWTCIDIGANIGAHTLSLAALATAGRVIAFEADPANHASLVRNAATLEWPKAWIEPHNLALWDAAATLTIGGANELAGCSFVVEGDANAAGMEAALRAVVNSPAIAATPLHVRLAQVQAVRLDDWATGHALIRLDLIKLDAEGAEANVIRGADATLRDLRPILLVEYNPACAARYFGQAPDALFRELELRFAAIHALEPDGTLSPISSWEPLRARLESGRGWEDLVCLHGSNEQD